jgi:hypothetical protein
VKKNLKLSTFNNDIFGKFSVRGNGALLLIVSLLTFIQRYAESNANINDSNGRLIFSSLTVKPFRTVTVPDVTKLRKLFALT